jgi:hypothetical protein
MNKAKADYENLIERCLKMLIAFGGPRNPDPSPEHEALLERHSLWWEERRADGSYDAWPRRRS